VVFWVPDICVMSARISSKGCPLRAWPIDVATSTGEESPASQTFWDRGGEPASDQPDDLRAERFQRVTGAYRFEVIPAPRR